jgi:flavodoxin
VRVLVVHASGYRPTAAAAEVVGDVLRGAGHDVVIWAARETPNPKNYDLVIAGSAVCAGNISKDLEHYFTKYREDLASKSIALFAIADRPRNGGEAYRRQAEAALLPLGQGMKCIARGSFVGGRDSRRTPHPFRLLARQAKTGSGDDFQREDIRAWAASLTEELAQ